MPIDEHFVNIPVKSGRWSDDFHQVWIIQKSFPDFPLVKVPSNYNIWVRTDIFDMEDQVSDMGKARLTSGHCVTRRYICSNDVEVSPYGVLVQDQGQNLEAFDVRERDDTHLASTVFCHYSYSAVSHSISTRGPIEVIC